MPVRERMTQVTPIIFHIDVNSAYLSWTAVEQLKNGWQKWIYARFRQSSAEIRNPVTALSLRNPLLQKNMASAQGNLVANAFRKCPNLVMYPPDHRMYREKSRQMMEYLKIFTKEIEAGQRR